MKSWVLLSLLLCSVAVIESRKVKPKQNHRHYDHQPQASEFYGSHDDNAQYVYQVVKSAPKAGYSAGSGLRSIAQGSADQATSAVASQHAAGKQAAFVAKNTLAQAATQAAATAFAALQGKEVLLHRLEHQTLEAHQSLEEELKQLHQAKRSAKAAQYSAQQAANHVAVLTAALNNAQTSAEHAQQAAVEAAAELASQTSMVGQAKAKVQEIEHQLEAARIDYEATREAAEKATYSAQEAQNNANEAAVHASIGLHEAVAKSTAAAAADEDHHTVGEIPSNHNYGEVSHHSLAGY